MQADYKDLRYLVADDMPNMRRTIRNMLRHLGCTQGVIEAENGEDAWGKMQSTTVEFIIADLRMPVMSGTELLRRVRANESFGNISFLMISAEAEETMVAEAAETEVDDYIVKPFVPETLKDKITEILTRKNNPQQGDILFNLGNVRSHNGRRAVLGKICHFRIHTDCFPPSNRFRQSLPEQRG